MSSSETPSKDAQETKKDDTVLPQIGEDPGLAADTIERESKAVDQRQNKQVKGIDRAKAKE
jgi:hypothetical protein